MTGARVLDSSALLVYFEAQPGCEKVTGIFEESGKEHLGLFISIVNWGEVLYMIERKHGLHRRDAIEHLMDQMNLEVVSPERDATREAAHFKAAYKLPYADCFAAALAAQRKAELVTSDKDFRAVEHKIGFSALAGPPFKTAERVDFRPPQDRARD